MSGVIRINTRKTSLTVLLYETVFMLYILYFIASASYLEYLIFIPISVWETIVRYAFPFALLVVYFIEGISHSLPLKSFIATIAIVALLLLQFNYVKSSGMINTFLFLIAYPRELSLKRFAKHISCVYLIGIAYVVISCQLGLITNYTRTRGDSDTIRRALGFVSANAFANTSAIGYLIYSYYKIDQWKPRNSAISLALGLCIYLSTNSRFATVIFLLISLVGILYNKIKNRKISKFFYAASTYLFSILSVATIFVTRYFSTRVGSGLYITLNLLFSTRLRWMVYYYNKYGISLFGQPIETAGIKEVATQGGTWMGLDNSYMMITIHYGIVFLVIFCIIYYLLGKHLKRTNDLYAAIICTIFILFGITENYLFNISYNFTLFIFAFELFSRGRQIQEE